MKAKLPAGTLQALWSNPAHWRAGGIYVCRDDPRRIVPKRLPVLGWTVNFAHRSSWAILIGILVVFLLPVAALEALGPVRQSYLFLCIAAYLFLAIATVVLCSLAAWPRWYEERASGPRRH